MGAYRLLFIVIGLVIIEGLLLSLWVDTSRLIGPGLGLVAKGLIVAAGIFALIVFSGGKFSSPPISRFHKRSVFSHVSPVRLLIHAMAALSLFGATFYLRHVGDSLTLIPITLWSAALAATLLSAFGVAVSYGSMLGWVRHFLVPLLVSMGLGYGLMVAIEHSGGFWQAVSQWTFMVSATGLEWLNQSVYVEAEAMLLGTDSFIVHIAPSCSGIEGMIINLAMSALFVLLHHRYLRLPRAFILIPIALGLSFLANCLRIVLLIIIGTHVSETLAVEGFHSVAGWLMAVALAFFVVFGLGSLKWFRKSDDSVSASTNPSQPMLTSDRQLPDPYAGALIPFIALLVGTLLMGLYTQSGPNPIYVVKALCMAGGLVWTRDRWWPLLMQELMRARSTVLFGLIAFALGAAMAVVWAWMHPIDTQANGEFAASFVNLAVWQQSLWLVIRVFGACLMVPLIEELFFRGYVMSKLSGWVGDLKWPDAARTIIPLLVSSALFAVMHQAWLVAALVGLGYGLIRLRMGLFAAVVAHGATNVMVVLIAFYTQQWLLL